MEDCFAELGLERRLAWTEEELRERYDARCREAHPDAGGDSEQFQRLRGAYAQLRSPGRRLRCWLELECGELAPGGEMEEALGGLFAELGPLFQRSEELARREAEARSLLMRSLVEREAMELMGGLEEAGKRIGDRIEELRERFAEFDRRGAGACREEAEATARSLLFLEKWEQQLRESWAKLAG